LDVVLAVRVNNFTYSLALRRVISEDKAVAPKQESHEKFIEILLKLQMSLLGRTNYLCIANDVFINFSNDIFAH
jgi:hypothetical protein